MSVIKQSYDSVKRLVRFLLVVLLAYLGQMCIVPYLSIGGVAPNMMLAVNAIITVCYGMLRSYWAGAFFGIAADAMMKPMNFFYLLMYPILGLFSSVFFADKSEKKLEELRTTNPAAHNVHPYIRTPFCAAFCQLLFESVHMLYLYIGGIPLEFSHYSRAFFSILYTVLLTLVLMIPVRRFLGYTKPPKEQKVSRGHYMKPY